MQEERACMRTAGALQAECVGMVDVRSYKPLLGVAEA